MSGTLPPRAMTPAPSQQTPRSRGQRLWQLLDGARYRLVQLWAKEVTARHAQAATLEELLRSTSDAAAELEQRVRRLEEWRDLVEQRPGRSGRDT